MIAFICALINATIIARCLLLKKSIFYPVCLLNFMWLAVNVMNMILGWNSGRTAYLILALPPLCFSIGFFISDRTQWNSRGWKFLTKDIEEDGIDLSSVTGFVQKLWRKTEHFFDRKVVPFFDSLDGKGRAFIDKKVRPALRIKSGASHEKKVTVCHGGMQPWALNTLLAGVCIVFLFYSCEFLFRLGQYNDGNIWLAFRKVTWNHGVNDKFVYKYASVVVFLLPSVLLISAQQSKNRKDYAKFFVSLGIAVLWSILRTSRTSTFTVVILLAMSQITIMEARNPKSLSEKERAAEKMKKLIIFISAAVFMVAIFLYVALKKNSGTYGDVSAFMFIIKSIANYTNLSSAAFVQWYEQGFYYTCGMNSFRFFIAVLYKLGIIAVVPAANSGGEYVSFGGLSTNALTVARAYVEDFGVVYMAIVLTIFGLIHGAVYKKTRRTSGRIRARWAMITAMLDIPLFFQILTNQYLNVLSAWIQYTVWICLFTSSLCWIKGRLKPKKSELPETPDVAEE